MHYPQVAQEDNFEELKHNGMRSVVHLRKTARISLSTQTLLALASGASKEYSNALSFLLSKSSVSYGSICHQVQGMLLQEG